MDTNESGGWQMSLADGINGVIRSWHVHRLAVAATILTLATITILVRRRSRPELAVASLSPASEEKLAWLDGDNEDAKKGSHRERSDSSNNLKIKPKTAATRVVVGRRPAKLRSPDSTESPGSAVIQPIVFFASLTGSTAALAERVSSALAKFASVEGISLPPQTFDLSYIELDDYFISGPKTIAPELPPKNTQHLYVLVVPSYDIDTVITNFLVHLNETHNDFRIDTAPLSSLLGYAVFGIGDRGGWPTEADGFCQQAIEIDKWLAKLTGRRRLYPLGFGDVKDDVDHNLQEWAAGLCHTIKDLSKTGSLGEGVLGSGEPIESGDEDADADFPASNRRKRQKVSGTIDLEDVGAGSPKQTSSSPGPIDFTTSSNKISPPKQMVPSTSPTFAALTKQGYTIVGSHSGVKICRWTKSALRGRGSCYKNSFYGIKSHLCMETTPSLSCSNKCVFCWRHGTNPVATTWRWTVDDPKLIFDGAKEGHYKKIKMMRGVPGVRAERFEEAMKIRHCALSLVGEPIFYPRINEFVDLLHWERISSFLVCNAQHPAELARLKRVTQLYVSIDAGNKESLRKVDRPLHRDFWERMMRCLDIIRERRNWQRTVYRLTLVKGFNVDEEIEGYANLVERGLPGFVEVKGVTYCGTSTSKGAGLTMGNVPFYEEVVTFVEALNKALEKRGLTYGIAAEHAHSCCILLADTRFLRDGQWCTLIDYKRFFELLESEQEFGPEDYCAPTPEWALWGNGGFDPSDQRVDRKGRPIDKDAARERKVVEIDD